MKGLLYVIIACLDLRVMFENAKFNLWGNSKSGQTLANFTFLVGDQIEVILTQQSSSRAVSINHLDMMPSSLIHNVNGLQTPQKYHIKVQTCVCELIFQILGMWTIC
jgi:hypothetical protein